MDAWSSDPIPARYLVKAHGTGTQGALVLQAKQCRNCHALDGTGGRRGPALDSVAVRLTPRSTDPPGDSGRREYAGIREESEPGGNHRPRGLPRNPASRGTGAGPRRCRCSRGCGYWNTSREALKAIMSSVAGAALASWSVPFWMTLGVLLAAILYIRGWRRLAYLRSTLLPGWRLACFLAGLTSLWLAIASPLDAFANFLLTAHMVQHLLMMVVAAPLILLGSPQNVLLRGLPRWAARDALGPFLSWRFLKRFGQLVTHPAFCWLAAAVALLAWHIPAAYDLALSLRAGTILSTPVCLERRCYFGGLSCCHGRPRSDGIVGQSLSIYCVAT